MRARRLLILVALLVAALCGPAGALAQGEVRLLRTARVEPGRPVLLADIAELRGDQAAAMAGLVIVQQPELEQTDGLGWFAVELATVRTALEAELGIEAGLLALRGGTCDVRVATPIVPLVGDAGTAEAPALPDRADALVGLETLRGAVGRELCRIYQASPADLRIRFEDADRAVLETPTRGRVVQVDPAGSSTRLPVRVALYEPGRVVVRETVQVEVEVRRRVVVMSRTVQRGTILALEDVATEERWVSPVESLATPTAALGAAARRTLEAGSLVHARHIEPPVVVERGDPVMVRVFLDGLVLRREAYAMESGREGETIELAPKHDTKTRFKAVLTGRGEAQVWPDRSAGSAPAGGGTPPQPREEPGTAVASPGTGG